MLNIKFMCGFVGIINNNIFQGRAIRKNFNLNNLISHRGPDNQKFIYQAFIVLLDFQGCQFKIYPL